MSIAWAAGSRGPTGWDLWSAVGQLHAPTRRTCRRGWASKTQCRRGRREPARDPSPTLDPESAQRKPESPRCPSRSAPPPRTAPGPSPASSPGPHCSPGPSLAGHLAVPLPRVTSPENTRTHACMNTHTHTHTHTRSQNTCVHSHTHAHSHAHSRVHTLPPPHPALLYFLFGQEADLISRLNSEGCAPSSEGAGAAAHRVHFCHLGTWNNAYHERDARSSDKMDCKTTPLTDIQNTLSDRQAQVRHGRGQRLGPPSSRVIRPRDQHQRAIQSCVLKSDAVC